MQYRLERVNMLQYLCPHTDIC